MPRGRKLDGQKGLNKQLIHQRAFRKRRTERLAELEDRKHQLEEENARLRSNQIQPDVDAIDNTKVAVPCPTCLIYDTQKDELVSLINSRLPEQPANHISQKERGCSASFYSLFRPTAMHREFKESFQWRSSHSSR